MFGIFTLLYCAARAFASASVSIIFGGSFSHAFSHSCVRRSFTWARSGPAMRPLPIVWQPLHARADQSDLPFLASPSSSVKTAGASADWACAARRSEEHTSELQSPCNLVCRLLLEKKQNNALP